MNYIYIILLFVRNLLKIFADDFFYSFTRDLPSKVQSITIDNLNTLLSIQGVLPPFVSKITNQKVSAPSSNCENTIIGIESCLPEEHSGLDLPKQMYIKLPTKDLPTRAFCNILGIWELECLFYQKVAPKLNIRTPKAYASFSQGSRFFLALEDLGTTEDVTLFHNQHRVIVKSGVWAHS